MNKLIRKMSAVKFIDIGVNLTDTMYQGEYHGKSKHKPDLENVLERSWQNGLDKMIITGGSLEDAKKALEVAKMSDKLYATVGCHPTRCNEFNEFSSGPEGYISALKDLIETNKDKVVAIGECGLDYDRINFCSAEVQKKYFEAQLDLCESLSQFPLFLHCRAAAQDMIEILKRKSEKLPCKGVIHSFDGTLEEAKTFIDLGYDIGLNGCSLKTRENLEVVKELPLESLQLETDAPWCEIRATHASATYLNTTFQDYTMVKKPDKWVPNCIVKGRNEPIYIHHVLDVVSGVKGESREKVAEILFENSQKMFFTKKK